MNDMNKEKKSYKRIPQEIPPVGVPIYTYSLVVGKWHVQHTSEGKPYVKILHRDQFPIEQSHGEWIGVSNPRHLHGFIVFLDEEPQDYDGIILSKVFGSCGVGHIYNKKDNEKENRT
jgi:hypothetical protein